MEEEFLDTPATLYELGVSIPTLRKLVISGQLAQKRTGRGTKVFYPAADVRRVAQQRRREDEALSHA